MAPETDPGEAMLDRFVALRRWLRGLHVCWTCSDTLAFVQIERERGTKGVKATLECKTQDRCRERANAGRKTMPR
jgi:hypothetical protein